MSAHVGRVLVTDGARSSALALVRSLGRAGWHVTAADVDGHSPGLSSRFVARRLRYTSPGHDAARFVDDLAAETNRNHVDLLIPVTDNAILPLANARERFHPATRLALPENHALELARDKLRTVTLARDLGVPVPATVFASTAAEAIAVLRDVGPPVVLKPRFSRLLIDNRVVVSSQVSYAFDAADVARAFNQAPAPGGFLVQEYTPGTGVGVELLLEEGKPLLMFQHRRIREVPLTGGPSSLRESVALDPVLCGYAGAILERMRWTGLAMVEFKLTPDGPRLMEVNGRVWGSLPLAVACGIDFPAAMAHLLTGRGAAPVPTTYQTGVRRRNLELELAWIAAALRRDDDSRLGVTTGTSPWRVLLSIPASLGEIDSYEPDDMRPLAVELLRVGELIWRRIRSARK